MIPVKLLKSINNKKSDYKLKKNIQNTVPPDFIWRNYLELNSDLPREFNEDDCKQHFINHGRSENRNYKIKLPDDFDWQIYKKFNIDLPIYFDEEDYKKHFLTYGMYENRIFKKEHLYKNKTMQQKDVYIYILYVICGFYLTFNNFKKFVLIHLNNNINLDKEKELDSVIDSVIDSVLDFTKKNNNSNSTVPKILDSVEFVNYDYLDCYLLLNTRNFYNESDKYLQFKIDKSELNNLNDFILIIDFKNGGGGTTHFLNCIVSKYKMYQTFVIARNYDDLLHLNINEEYEIKNKFCLNESIDFLNIYKKKISKIFINHIDGHNKLFLDKLFTLNISVYTLTHDFSIITNCYQPFFHDINIKILDYPPIIDDPNNKYQMIITQNIKNLTSFKNINFDFVVELPDFKKTEKLIMNDNSDKIIVAIIGNINDIKGKHILIEIIEYYKKKSGVEIVVIGNVVIPEFNNFFYYNSIDGFNKILLKVKPHILFELSLWPETYSYTLTLGMLTNLPILYFKKTFESVVENRLSNYDKAYPFHSIDQFNKLIYKHKQNHFYTILPIIYFNKFWNDLFITKTKLPQYIKNKETHLHSKYKYDIKPYFIYFPQFHKIKENDFNFFNDYTDIINLSNYNLLNENKIAEPSLDYFKINKLIQYNYINNQTIVQKQIDLIDLYNFEGLAVYYYWFSENSITNQNMIMEKAIDQLFDNSINLKNKQIFFIWANENWTDNVAFVKKTTSQTQRKHSIINYYTTDEFINNSQNLIKYFKHQNYLKIDNKPVFFIYHSYLLTDDEINNFYAILNKICCENYFSGVHLVLNSFVKKYDNFTNFYINFNYKLKSLDGRFFDQEQKQIYLDYKKYINNSTHIKENTIQTICYDFNNKPRLFEPDKIEFSTVCINNTEYDKIKFTKNILKTYDRIKNSDLENILLINALNEWGENMAFEPSNKYQFYNLNLLKECLEEKEE